ncbi:sigma-70 family RNA polymerase sigma factor [Winogradskyella sp.]|nr:sigma-70 family RNA polymerase sigma factor [Winogradskyella sp.]MDC1504176.1 sigma-70 family RNA polymerase sigma factor [Winogradskyella sp.]
MKTNLSNFRNKGVLRLRVEQAFKDLIAFKKEENRVSFNTQLLNILPEVKKYINGRLNVAIKKGHFSKNKYKADDVIDQLFIEIYKHIDEVNKSEDFYLWLFKKTNELLEDIIVIEEFDDFFFKNIDAYSKSERDEMIENYSTDGDGDLVMIEALDDSSYNHNDYTLNHVFIEDDEKELTDKIDKSLSEDAINRHINMVLHNLPIAMHNVFDLFTNQQFSIEEIAEIRNSSITEVEKLLTDAKKALQLSLFNRNTTT